MKDYLADITVVSGDKLDSGVKGMKWGVSRSSAQLKVAAGKREATKPRLLSDMKVQDDGAETSAQRYSRMKAESKTGAKDWPDSDLKFFNARTEALGKVAKLNETKPGWLNSTLRDVAQNTAKTQLSAISAAIATKYISDKLIGEMNKTDLAGEISKKVSAIKNKDAIDAGVSKAIETSDYLGRHKSALPGNAAYRGKRSK